MFLVFSERSDERELKAEKNFAISHVRAEMQCIAV